MNSVWLSLALLFLGILCTSSAPTSDGNGTWIFVPVGKGSFTRQPKKEYSVQPRWIHEPKKLDSSIKKQYNKQENSIVSCGSHSLDPGQTVTIQSENFPGKYPVNEDCRWTFQGTSADSTLTISCRVFELKACRMSSMTITGGGLNERYCRGQSGLTETSNDNNMVIYFRTNRNKRRRRGFSCTVSASAPPTTSTTSSTSTSTEASCKPCGTVNRVTRIVGGVETEVNEYPWQVAIVHSGTNDVICGGSLLNDALVITATHCVMAFLSNIASVEVLVGAHDLDNPTDVQQRINLAQALYHSGYNSSTQDHDLGVLLLLTPAVLSDRVKPVCLPDIAKDYSGYEAVTSGWGRLSEGGSQPSILNEVDVPILTNADCNVYYPSEITSNMICAGYPEGDKDSCQGDSGGPLVVEDNGSWVLVGITSWGNGCARPNSPGVYCRVNQYIGVLAEVLGVGDNNLCDSTS